MAARNSIAIAVLLLAPCSICRPAHAEAAAPRHWIAITGKPLAATAGAEVLDPAIGPADGFNVIAPGKRPRVTLTPSLALRDGKPFLAFAVQGGDTQDQNLLQFFLNVVEFGMDVQEAVEAATG